MKFSASKFTKDPNVITLKAGESVTGILRGEPHEFSKAFNPGDKPGFRFRLNMVVADGNELKARIIEGGWKLYQQLKVADESGWDLEKSYTKITRQGSTKQDTIYTANVLPTKVTEATLSRVAKVPLHELKTTAAAAPEAREPGSDDGDFEAPYVQPNP